MVRARSRLRRAAYRMAAVGALVAGCAIAALPFETSFARSRDMASLDGERERANDAVRLTAKAARRARKAREKDRKEKHCLATAIYFEARGESVKGQKAVAEVILSRMKTPGRPKTICGVVYEGSWRKTGCQFSFTCDGRSDRARPGAAWTLAKKLAAAAMKPRGTKKRFAKGATFYHANYVRPKWSKRMVKVARIGAHIFYRPRKGRLL